MITVVGEKTSMVFRKDLYWDHFFSMFSFVIITDDFKMANYADGTTPYIWGKDISSVIKPFTKCRRNCFNLV